MKPLTKTQIRKKAIRNYKEIKDGKVNGLKIKPLKSIKVGSITFEI